MLSDQRRMVVGPLIVAALGIVVWWMPDLAAFIFFPPLVLGVGVGFVARYTDAPPSVLVMTAAASTAIIFGVYVAAGFVVRIARAGARLFTPDRRRSCICCGRRCSRRSEATRPERRCRASVTAP